MKLPKLERKQERLEEYMGIKHIDGEPVDPALVSYLQMHDGSE